MQPEDRIRLLHILESTSAISRMVAGRTLSDVELDDMLSLALQRALEIIGEAASRLSPETRQLDADVPWGRMTGMRNRLAHAYFDIDPAVLWRTATEEAPDLAKRIEAMLSR